MKLLEAVFYLLLEAEKLEFTEDEKKQLKEYGVEWLTWEYLKDQFSPVLSFGTFQATLNKGELKAKIGEIVKMTYDFGKKEGWVDEVFLDKIEQGKKIAPKFLALQFPLMQKLGFSSVRIVAIQVGAYAWLAYGFVLRPQDATEICESFYTVFKQFGLERPPSIIALSVLRVPIIDVNVLVSKATTFKRNMDYFQFPTENFYTDLESAVTNKFYVRDGTFLLGKFFLIQYGEMFGWEGKLDISEGGLKEVMTKISQMAK